MVERIRRFVSERHVGEGTSAVRDLVAGLLIRVVKQLPDVAEVADEAVRVDDLPPSPWRQSGALVRIATVDRAAYGEYAPRVPSTYTTRRGAVRGAGDRAGAGGGAVGARQQVGDRACVNSLVAEFAPPRNPTSPTGCRPPDPAGSVNTLSPLCTF
jgi:hypothetical protein